MLVNKQDKRHLKRRGRMIDSECSMRSPQLWALFLSPVQPATTITTTTTTTTLESTPATNTTETYPSSSLHVEPPASRRTQDEDAMRHDGDHESLHGMEDAHRALTCDEGDMQVDFIHYVSHKGLPPMPGDGISQRKNQHEDAMRQTPKSKHVTDDAIG